MTRQQRHTAQARGLSRGWMLVISLFTTEMLAICLAIVLGR